MNNPVIDAIKSILLKDHCESTTNCMELKDNDSKMVVQLKDIPPNGLLINVPGDGKAHLGIIEPEKGLQIACDKLLLIDREKYVDVYIIELKKSFSPNKYGVPQKAADQILHTIPVVDYLISMAKIHRGKSKKTKQHYTVIAQNLGPRLNKQEVKFSSPFKEFEYKKKRFNLIISTSEKIQLRNL